MENSNTVQIENLIPSMMAIISAGQKLRKLYDSLPDGKEKDRVNILAANAAALQLEVGGWMDELELRNK